MQWPHLWGYWGMRGPVLDGWPSFDMISNAKETDVVVSKGLGVLDDLLVLGSATIRSSHATPVSGRTELPLLLGRAASWRYDSDHERLLLELLSTQSLDWERRFAFDADGTAHLPKLKTSEIVLTTSAWADDVFAPGYPLLPLPELASFLATHHRLPSMPSADEVAQNGYSLNESHVTLVRKIEELTLCLIDQQQRINELEQQVATLHGNGQNGGRP